MRGNIVGGDCKHQIAADACPICNPDEEYRDIPPDGWIEDVALREGDTLLAAAEKMGRLNIGINLARCRGNNLRLVAQKYLRTADALEKANREKDWLARHMQRINPQTGLKEWIEVEQQEYEDTLAAVESATREEN